MGVDLRLSTVRLVSASGVSILTLPVRSTVFMVAANSRTARKGVHHELVIATAVTAVTATLGQATLLVGAVGALSGHVIGLRLALVRISIALATTAVATEGGLGTDKRAVVVNGR